MVSVINDKIYTIKTFLFLKVHFNYLFLIIYH